MKYIFIILSLMISHTASAQLEKRLDSVINSSIIQGEPGLALYVEKNGETMYNKGFGMADIERKNKIKPNTGTPLRTGRSRPFARNTDIKRGSRSGSISFSFIRAGSPPTL